MEVNHTSDNTNEKSNMQDSKKKSNAMTLLI